MVDVDCDAVQAPLPQAWISPAMMKKLEVAGVKPGVLAARL